MLRRVVLFILAFAAGYRVAHVAVDAAGRAALRVPWRESPRLLAGETASAVRHRIADPLQGRVSDAREAIVEGREAKHRREGELRSDLNL